MIYFQINWCKQRKYRETDKSLLRWSSMRSRDDKKRHMQPSLYEVHFTSWGHFFAASLHHLFLLEGEGDEKNASLPPLRTCLFSQVHGETLSTVESAALESYESYRRFTASSTGKSRAHLSEETLQVSSCCQIRSKPSMKKWWHSNMYPSWWCTCSIEHSQEGSKGEETRQVKERVRPTSW